MATETKKLRKPNFSDKEVRCMLESIGQEKEPIQSKLQGALTGRLKKEVWPRVVLRVNSCSRGILRSLEEIKKKWKDLKSAVMKEQASQRQTGGGGPMKETPFKDLILYIIGDRSDAVCGIEVFGTDSFLASQTQECSQGTLDRGSSCIQLDPTMASTSNVGDNTLNNSIKRRLDMSSTSVSGAIDSDSSDADLPAEANTGTDNVNELTTASARSGGSTGNNVQPNRRRQAKSKSTEEDKLFCDWLQSEIAKNFVKTELLELKKRKTLLEIQNLESKSGNDKA